MEKTVKLLSFAIISILLFSFLSSIAIAAFDFSQATGQVENFVSAVRDSLSKLVSDENKPIFIKTLFFILVFLIIGAVMSSVPLFGDKPGISWFVSLIVAILSVFFIPTEFITPMLNPYSALGIALISIIPFAILFFFVKSLNNQFLESLTWMFYAIMLLALSVYTSINTPTEGLWAAWVYGIASVIALIMVFLYHPLKAFLWKERLKTYKVEAQATELERITNKLDILAEEIHHAISTKGEDAAR